jgi:hypothetical protein
MYVFCFVLDGLNGFDLEDGVSMDNVDEVPWQLKDLRFLDTSAAQAMNAKVGKELDGDDFNPLHCYFCAKREEKKVKNLCLTIKIFNNTLYDICLIYQEYIVLLCFSLSKNSSGLGSTKPNT